MKKAIKKRVSNTLPESFRPLLWGLKWSTLTALNAKEDIIVRIVNDGDIRQWRWIIERYGKRAIRTLLSHRLVSELYPESRNLARVVFGVNLNHYVRRGTGTKSKKLNRSSHAV